MTRSPLVADTPGLEYVLDKRPRYSLDQSGVRVR
jgi:hypothetical protein